MNLEPTPVKPPYSLPRTGSTIRRVGGAINFQGESHQTNVNGLGCASGLSPRFLAGDHGIFIVPRANQES